jgi:hypothetical protein
LSSIQFEEDCFELRSQSQHLEHCALLEDEEDDYVENSRDVGVNHRSILLDLQYFDMCSGALLPDVMHDVLEGALQYEVKLLLQYCREKRHFSDHNEAIEGMELGYMETDRPAPIPSKTLYARDSNSLKQKGMSDPPLVHCIAGSSIHSSLHIE